MAEGRDDTKDQPPTDEHVKRATDDELEQTWKHICSLLGLAGDDDPRVSLPKVLAAVQALKPVLDTGGLEAFFRRNQVVRVGAIIDKARNDDVRVRFYNLDQSDTVEGRLIGNTFEKA